MIFNRKGVPGGPGCGLSVSAVRIPGTGKDQEAAHLLSAEPEAAELEMLRAVASRLGVRWGRDASGWWAVVAEGQLRNWAVWRQDDYGNLFLMQGELSEREAKEKVAHFEALGHKQAYFARETVDGEG